MADFTRGDVVAMVRAAERASETGDAMPLAAAVDLLDHAEALQTIAVLVVMVEAAHRSGATGQSWSAFLDGLDR